VPRQQARILGTHRPGRIDYSALLEQRLGLSIAWDIVTQQHGGTIAVDFDLLKAQLGLLPQLC
jgi:hypothetical protein